MLCLLCVRKKNVFQFSETEQAKEHIDMIEKFSQESITKRGMVNCITATFGEVQQVQMSKMFSGLVGLKTVLYL